MRWRQDILTQFVGYKKAILNGAAATSFKSAVAGWGSFKIKVVVYNKDRKIRETHLKDPGAPLDY
jgi:hypothetical protein